jgi:hypothetical protein
LRNNPSATTRAYLRTDPSPAQESQPLGSVPSLQTPRTRARLSSLEAKRRQSDPLPATQQLTTAVAPTDPPRRGSLSVKQLQASFLTGRERRNTVAHAQPSALARPVYSEEYSDRSMSNSAMVPSTGRPVLRNATYDSTPNPGAIPPSPVRTDLEPSYPRASITQSVTQPDYSSYSPPLSPVEPSSARSAYPPAPRHHSGADPNSSRQLYTSSPLRHIRRSPTPEVTSPRRVSDHSERTHFDYSADVVARQYDSNLGVAPLSPLHTSRSQTPQAAPRPLQRQRSKAFGTQPTREGDEPRMQVSAASHLDLNQDGAQLQSTARFNGPVLTVASSAGGSRVAAGGKDGAVRLYDAFQGVVTQELRYHQGSVHAVAFSPRGSRLASAGDDTRIAVWEVLTGTLQHELTQHKV